MARLFVAIEIPAPLAAALLATVPVAPGLRVASPDQVHLTLHFLGDCDPAQAGAVESALAGVQGEPLVLEAYGVGRFRGRQGSVLWAGVEISLALAALHAATGEALAGAGIAPDKRGFHPHLTLARCRAGLAEAQIREWLAAGRTLASPAWTASRFVLFESHLLPEGARHVCRRVYGLGVPPA